MSTKRVLGCVGFMVAFILSASHARADGGIFPPPDASSSETRQRAFIYYHDKTEELVISASYQGDAKDFAWVIPTPSRPEVSKSYAELFTKLNKITKIESEIAPLAAMEGFGATAPAKSPPVEVIEEKTIDIYDTAVLKATDERALAKWLADHGYNFPQSESVMLKDYVANGWYFAIAKIQDSAAQSRGVERQLSYGAITPLRFAFQSDKIIYPMKLTRVALDFADQNYKKLYPMESVSQSAPPDEIAPGIGQKASLLPISYDIPITLYVLTDSKVEHDSLETIWAKWLSPGELEQINKSASSDNWIPTHDKLFLTKLQKTVDFQGVSDDFKVDKAKDNTQYPAPAYTTGEFWATNVIAFVFSIFAFVLSPIGILFILALILQFLVRRKWLYILCSVYEILSTLLIVPVWLLLVVDSSEQGLRAVYNEAGSGGLTAGLLIGFLAAGFFSIFMLARYKKFFART